MNSNNGTIRLIVSTACLDDDVTINERLNQWKLCKCFQRVMKQSQMVNQMSQKAYQNKNDIEIIFSKLLCKRSHYNGGKGPLTTKVIFRMLALHKPAMKNKLEDRLQH